MDNPKRNPGWEEMPMSEKKVVWSAYVLQLEKNELSEYDRRVNALDLTEHQKELLLDGMRNSKDRTQHMGFMIAGVIRELPECQTGKVIKHPWGTFSHEAEFIYRTIMAHRVINRREELEAA